MSIGADISRVDGLSKLSGGARFVDDLRIENCVHGGTIRSTIARGRIKNIRFDPAVNWSECVVVDHRDIPGKNEIAMIESDQPALAHDAILHKHEPIVLIAHRSPRGLREALRAVQVEIEPLPAVTDPHQILESEHIQFGDDNIFKRIDIRKGDPRSIFSKAPHVFEGTYHTGAQEHVYLETQGMVAHQEDGRLVIQGSMQCPYYVLDALTRAFGRPREAFRVIQSPVGGGFGGKEDHPSMLAVHAALLAEKCGSPVKMIYDRQEDMAVTTKRHPSWVRHRTALDADGRLLAMEIDVLLDGGAYATLSPVVLSRGCLHATGPYACDNIHIHGEVRLTNSPPYGAFRGFGAPQTLFAVERHMDMIARRMGMDPVVLRQRNLLRDGDTMATGQVYRDGADLSGLLERSTSQADFAARRARHAVENSKHPYLRRGMGVATFFHGSGFTGSGETYLASEVWAEGMPDGGVEVLTAQTDMGQGTSTILAQIAAEAIGIDVANVVIATPDTSRVPNSGPTVASRTAMVVGKLVAQACEVLVARVSSQPIRGAAVHTAIRDWHKNNAGQRIIGRVKYKQPKSIHWDEDNYRGDAYACYSWGAYVAEVEVDLRTFAVRVVDFVASQEVGRVINPTLARGQVQGGVAQGIGWALYEDVILEEGAMKNAQMTNYVIPGSGDLPPIRVFFEERPSRFGPGGAKGIGEMPIDGPAPAVINAVCDALDTSIHAIPLTPERLMTHLEGENIGQIRA